MLLLMVMLAAAAAGAVARREGAGWCGGHDGEVKDDGKREMTETKDGVVVIWEKKMSGGVVYCSAVDERGTGGASRSSSSRRCRRG